MNTQNIFSNRYLDAALRGIESARIKDGIGNGLFTATSFNPANCKTTVTYGDSKQNDDNYSLSWVRDTLKCSIYDIIAGNTENVKATLYALLNYFKNNKVLIEQVITLAKQQQKLKFDQHAILPRMHPLTLEPVDADQRKNLQLDMAEILKNIAISIKNGFFVARTYNDILLVKQLINYFISWNYSFNGEYVGDFGIWEEGKGGTTGHLEPDIHSSSIAAMLAGYIAIDGCELTALDNSREFISIDKDIIDDGYKLLNERISVVGETEERAYDLTSLIILYDHLVIKEIFHSNLLSEQNIQLVLKNFSKLERKNGFVRYASDTNMNSLDNYHQAGSPEGKSAEWTMGFCYAALIYNKLGCYDKAIHYIQKTESVFDWKTGLGLPEAYFGGTDIPVPISPLTWSNSLYLTAYEEMKKNLFKL